MESSEPTWMLQMCRRPMPNLRSAHSVNGESLVALLDDAGGMAQEGWNVELGFLGTGETGQARGLHRGDVLLGRALAANWPGDRGLIGPSGLDTRRRSGLGVDADRARA